MDPKHQKKIVQFLTCLYDERNNLFDIEEVMSDFTDTDEEEEEMIRRYLGLFIIECSCFFSGNIFPVSKK